MNTIKVTLPAGSVPENSIVSVIGGTHRYKMLSVLNIGGRKIENDGCKFLFGITNPDSINTIPETKEVVWVTTEKSLYEWLEVRMEENK